MATEARREAVSRVLDRIFGEIMSADRSGLRIDDPDEIIAAYEAAEPPEPLAKLDRMRVGMAALQMTCDELQAKNDRLLVEVETLRDRCLANQAQHLELLASPPAPARYEVSEWNGTGWTQVWRDASD
jgi:hypothetical protein